ncbi:hypothetical protein FisN_21Hh022 [Fistulifera solaris]|uniref:PDZ domain-containing protein n=1 Tax=Fistulifera solaris TaxID=1519565 RepID=A0A1Z5KAU6_FISSO|nr:hypothetical protein FisN_21Hh022 [Fistulifera solaris]|eukprot:GAX23292.1 hypothetical protein FisN_21Hh022 [Fistulifera solaris]
MSNNNQQGLMKKLFLPTFTDAGSNETFQQSTYQATDETHSEASTAVHDNRSHVKRQFHSSAHRSINANRPPPFFASTRPVSVKQHASEVETPVETPERQPFGSTRTLSTVALARGVSASSTDERIELDDNSDTDQVARANAAIAHQRIERFDIERDGDTEHNQLSVVRTEIHSRKVEETPWEEEATPEQTAFGKQLLFARKHPTALSDVLSTASEMGTVIEYNDKLAELENMEFHSPSPIRTYREKQETQSPRNSLERRTEKSDISMPVLDEVVNKTNRDSEYDEKKGSEQEEDILHKFKPSHTTSALLSKAFKRIGTGIAHGSRVVMSAPTTPLGASRMAHSTSPQFTTSNTEIHKSSQTSGAVTGTPSSFLLRSPGSKAFELASSQPRDLLRPRFSSRNRGHSVGSRIDEDQPTEIMRRPHQTAFQIARSCFSYDAYDSAMDDMFEVSATETDNDFMPSSYGGVRRPTPLEHPPIIRTSASWDAAGVSQVRSARFKLSHQRRRQELWDADSIENKGWEAFHAVNFKDSSEPASIIHEVSASPQSKEFEREDAINILACLVERGVSLRDREGRSASNREIDGPVEGNSVSRLGADTTRSTALSGVDELRDMVLASNTGENSLSYERRLVALDELLRSHEYAQEMRRASESALTWLKTVDYSAGPTLRQPNHSKERVVESEFETLPEGLDLATAKALLRSSQLKVKEKCDLADKLNEELAKCRAEIGRLRSSSQATTTFKSPDRSILDESEDALPEDDASQNKSFDTASTPIVAIDDSGFVEASFLMNEYDPPGALFPDQRISTVEGASLAMYQKALDDANEQIRKLQAQLNDAIKNGKNGHVPSFVNKGIRLPLRESSADQSQDQLLVDEENYETDWSQLSSGLPPPPDHDLHNPIVNAVLEQWSNDPGLHHHLLDWMEAVLEGGDASSIPPLMISNLEAHVRDGFVMHVLPQLLRRADIRVDVQTRTRRVTAHDLSVTVEPSDPFRSKQSVLVDDDVGSTTHSTTTSITGNTLLARKRTGSIGSAKRPSPYDGISKVSYDEIAEDGIGADQPHGLMSALGGALGGLLARRRPPHLSGLSDGPGSPLDVSPSAQSAAVHVAAAAEAFGSNQGKPVFLDEGSGDDQPYHRVVSAPAGRIGVTFVQYRGHAMVSDVAPDSPLAGWIFPSDILIAIDELPVSGMPVRDIIKVLMDRKQKQRALRVISSHAMNELSLNTSLMMDAGN